MKSEFSSEEFSPIFIELLDPIKSEGNVVFLFYPFIFCSQGYQLDVNLELFEDSWFQLFSDFELVPDSSIDTLLIVDFQATHLYWNFIFDELVPQNLQMKLAQTTQ